MRPRSQQEPNKGKPNIDELARRFNISPKLLESVADVEITMTLGEWLEEDRTPGNRISWTEEDGLDYRLAGQIRPGKKLAIGGTIVTIVGIVVHTIYTHSDAIIRALSN